MEKIQIIKSYLKIMWIVENISNCDNLNKTSYSSFFIPLNIEAEASPVRAFLKKD